MASADLGDYLICDICLKTSTDPAGLTCGHNFCWVCINSLLDRQDQSSVYFCPSCRHKFQKRPEPIRNINLRRIVNKCLPTQPKCIEASGEKHLEVHNTSEPSTNTEHKCFLHKKTLAYYCAEDKSIICADCLAEGHQGHLVETVEVAAEKRKAQVRIAHQKMNEHKCALSQEIDIMYKCLKKAHGKALSACDIVYKQFIDIVKEVNKFTNKNLQKNVEHSHKFSYLINQQEIKLDKVISRLRHIKKLCNTTDASTVLQDSETGDLCKPEGEGDEDSGGHDSMALSIDILTESIDQVNDLVQHLFELIHFNLKLM